MDIYGSNIRVVLQRQVIYPQAAMLCISSGTDCSVKEDLQLPISTALSLELLAINSLDGIL